MDSCFALIGAHQYGIAVIVLSLSRIKISKIQVNQQWRQSACSLRGRPLKGKGKEIPDAREARTGAQGKGKGTFPTQGQAYPWAGNSDARQLWSFFPLSFPEFDVNSFKDFQSDQIQRNSRKNIHCSLRMQEFEFDTSNTALQHCCYIVSNGWKLFQHLNAKNSRCELSRVNINLTDSFFK